MTGEERLVLDLERVDRYRMAVAATDDTSVFTNEIQPDVWDYANRTLPSLIASGEIFTIRSRAGGIAASDLVMPPDGIPFTVAEDLGADAIVKALKPFEKAVQDKWDGYRPNAATLGTYFVGLCSQVFPGPFRKWDTQAGRLSGADVLPEQAIGATSVWDQPEAVIYDIEFERHIEIIGDPLEEAIVRYDVDGATNREIAEVLQITEKTVEYRLKKTRAAGQARWRQEATTEIFRETGRLTA